MYRILVLSLLIIMSQQAYVLIDFTRKSDKSWQIVDDVVMGGVSSGNF